MGTRLDAITPQIFRIAVWTGEAPITAPCVKPLVLDAWGRCQVQSMRQAR